MNLGPFRKKGKRRQIIDAKEEAAPRFKVSFITKAFDGAPIFFFYKVKDPKRYCGEPCGTRERICSTLKF